jgi:hypothetical protein
MVHKTETIKNEIIDKINACKDLGAKWDVLYRLNHLIKNSIKELNPSFEAKGLPKLNKPKNEKFCINCDMWGNCAQTFSECLHYNPEYWQQLFEKVIK